MRDPLLYRIVRPFIIGWFKTMYKPIIINKDAIPKKGRVVIAGNHISKQDPFIMAAATKRCIRGVAKSELFKGPGKYLFKGLGAIPVNRKIKDESVIPACVELLKNESLVGIMPEGTINRTEEVLMPFKTGAVRMAIESNSPIIPFAIIGETTSNYGAFKKGVKMIFGELYYPESNDVIHETKILESKVYDLINENKERKIMKKG